MKVKSLLIFIALSLHLFLSGCMTIGMSANASGRDRFTDSTIGVIIDTGIAVSIAANAPSAGVVYGVLSWLAWLGTGASGAQGLHVPAIELETGRQS